MVKTIKLEYNGKEEEFTLKELTFGEENTLLEDSTTFSMENGVSKMKLSQKKYKENLVLKSLVKAPFEINIENVRGLSKTNGKILTAEAEGINEISEEKKSN